MNLISDILTGALAAGFVVLALWLAAPWGRRAWGARVWAWAWWRKPPTDNTTITMGPAVHQTMVNGVEVGALFSTPRKLTAKMMDEIKAEVPTGDMAIMPVGSMVEARLRIPAPKPPTGDMAIKPLTFDGIEKLRQELEAAYPPAVARWDPCSKGSTATVSAMLIRGDVLPRGRRT